MTPTELFTNIDLLLSPNRKPRIEGWCTPAKAYDLACSVLTLRPKVTVEIGVFGGASLIPIALALRCVGYGQVIGIDPWDAAESIKGMTGENLKWWSEQDHEAIYQGFQNALISEGVSNQVIVFRQTSQAAKVPEVIDFLHCDGNHGEQAENDTMRFGGNVRVGGLAFLDDLGWDGGSVGRSAAWLLKNGFVELYKRDTGAMFQRVRKTPIPPIKKFGKKR